MNRQTKLNSQGQEEAQQQSAAEPIRRRTNSASCRSGVRDAGGPVAARFPAHAGAPDHCSPIGGIHRQDPSAPAIVVAAAAGRLQSIKP
jgi:hypothetical protein